MPNCSASGCTNSSMKGKLMKVFPRDPTRRKLWAAKVKRLNWQPTDNSYLCEDHFDETQWEKPRVDGKRKLKCSAVPTIFGHTTQSKLRKPPKKLNSSLSSVPNKDQTSYLLDHTYNTKDSNNCSLPLVVNISEPSDPETNENTNYIVPMLITSNIAELNNCCISKNNEICEDIETSMVENVVDDIVPMFLTSSNVDLVSRCSNTNKETNSTIEIATTKNTNDIVPIFLTTNTITDTSNSSIIPDTETNKTCSENNIDKRVTNEEMLQEIEHLKKCVNSQTLKIIELKARLRKSIISKSKLKEKSFNSIEMFTKFLNQDQMNSLRLKSTKGSTWSNSTLKRAIRLRYLCGPEGYKELLDQNYPLPSLRTIRRKLQIAECTLQEFYMNYSK